MKIRQQTAFGWKEVHNELLKQPFCHNRQQLVRIIICLEYNNCLWEGLCYPCFKEGIKHKLLYTPPIENIPLVKICSDTYDWHSAYKELVRGWKEIHEDILNAPFCEERQRIVNVKTFSNLYDMGTESTGVCSICYENGVIHHINLRYNEEFIRFWEEDD